MAGYPFDQDVNEYLSSISKVNIILVIPDILISRLRRIVLNRVPCFPCRSTLRKDKAILDCDESRESYVVISQP